MLGDADFVSPSAGAAVIVTVAVEAADRTTAPVGEVAAAVALLTTEPASASACVTAYEAVQVVASPGASVVTGQATEGTGPAGAVNVSAMLSPVTVWLPVLATANAYATVWPARLTVRGVAVLVRVIAAARVVVTVAVEAPDVTAPPVGSVPATVAVLTTEPLSRSVCATA